MKAFRFVKQKVKTFFIRPREVFIEIRGRELILAEGYCRLENYSDTEIILQSKYNTIRLKGISLNLRHISDERVAVEGRINSLEFL